jgi:hypothetical protein
MLAARKRGCIPGDGLPGKVVILSPAARFDAVEHPVEQPGGLGVLVEVQHGVAQHLVSGGG